METLRLNISAGIDEPESQPMGGDAWSALIDFSVEIALLNDFVFTCK